MSGYAVGQLRRALERAAGADDAGTRQRAAARAEQWMAVLDGIATGRLTIGARTPVAGTPAWVTLEVAHGGFATGRYLAESPLRADERERLPAGGTGTDRERLNLWYLGDEGLAELREALRTGRYRIEVPEEAALLMVAWLLDHGHDAVALELIDELAPFLPRLRFTPAFEPVAVPSGAAVRVQPVGEVRDSLRAATVRPALGTMLATLQVWNPLADRLLELWCETVEGDLPSVDRAAGQNGTVVGGWPCRRWPEGWDARRRQWLDDYRDALATTARGDSHRRRKSNFARLHSALERCPGDSSALSGREVGWIRRALANAIAAHGAPGSGARTELRATQAAVAGRPTHAAIAHALSARLEQYPADGGLPSIEPIVAPVEFATASATPVPAQLVTKVTRALEAPPGELVERGVIRSGEALAEVLPQLTARLLAANIDDTELATLFARTYTAFRRRRSLLLLDLQRQVQFDELPWIAATVPFRTQADPAGFQRRNQMSAGLALKDATMLALDAFPQAILPNPLVQELKTLATQAKLDLPLVEELAADIFTGRFTTKWNKAAATAGRLLDGTLYARYYSLPGDWETSAPRIMRNGLAAALLRKPRETPAPDFAGLCGDRAKEAWAGADRHGGVAAEGAVIEQSQILTTHNLAVLTDALDLTDWLSTTGSDLADRSFTWVIQRLRQTAPDWHSGLLAIKQVAYAWRQAIYFLSFQDLAAQRTSVARLQERAAVLGPRFAPAVDGLTAIVEGAAFDTTGHLPPTTNPPGRRLLGWSVGPHWYLTDHR